MSAYYKERGPYRGAKISTTKLEHVVRCFARNLSVSEASRETNVSRPTVGRLFRELRRRVFIMPEIHGGLWDAEAFEPPEAPFWAELQRCVYDCPMQYEAGDFRTTFLPNNFQKKAGTRVPQTRRIAIHRRKSCDDCRIQLNSEKLDAAYYRELIQFRWKVRRIDPSDFRDIYFSMIFRAKRLHSGVFSGTETLESNRKIGQGECVDLLLASFAREPHFLTTC